MTEFSSLVELLLAKEYHNSVCPSYNSSVIIYYCEIIFTSQGSYQREKWKNELTNILMTDISIGIIAGFQYPFPNTK